MRHFWQWFRGYLQVCLRGRQVNRFLNLCSRNGIPLWRITYDLERMVNVHVRLQDFYILKPYLKKTKTHLRIINKRGFPFWCYRHPRLKWTLVCLCFCIAMFFYSRLYIWDIQITGNDRISTYMLQQYLEENDITTGKKSSDIDCSNIEYLLRKEFKQLGWVSVYCDKTSLCIEIKESLYDKFEDFPVKDGMAYHLTANKDAYIDSIVTQAGTPVVTAGMQVKKGDILVLGQCEILDDIGEVKEILNVQAKAIVYGDVTYSFLSPLNEMEILGAKIAGIYSDKTIKTYANQKMYHFIEKLEENGVIILGKNVMIDKKDKNIVIMGFVNAREQIGINIPVEEVWEHESE